jgi:hypothetical protein
MQANPKSLQALVNSATRFVIPEYQRPYCWSKEEVEQLWNDLSEASGDADRAVAAGSEVEEYFLGSVVVAKRKEKGGEVAYVVDGQQRITTLHALLWVALNRLKGEPSAEVVSQRLVRLLVTPSGAASLGVAKEDQSNFLAIQQGTPLDETRDLGSTGSFFRRRIVEAMTAETLVAFIEFVLDQTTFILVETESYASAWDLFIGLNGKGKPLNPADLIKAYVCGSSADGRGSPEPC